MERVWTSWARDGVMQFTGLYFAVLGGAYSSLAKANSHYVSVVPVRLDHIRIEMIVLTMHRLEKQQLVNDPIQECKCWLYYAEDLIHLRKLRKAEKILEAQLDYVSDLQNSVVRLLSLTHHVNEQMLNITNFDEY
jgi:hypothetical protein